MYKRHHIFNLDENGALFYHKSLLFNLTSSGYKRS